jgi:hypothetical protein
MRSVKPLDLSSPGFPVGAIVLIDGRVRARVKAYHPEWSTSHLFPHYKLDVERGDRNIAIRVSRVGVTAKP